MAFLEILLPALLAASAPPDAVPVTSADIVVTARAREIIRDFVGAMSDAGRSGQLARWENEVCPGIIGIAQEQAELLNGRIGDVARGLGLRPGGRGCRPTMLILFTGDADGLGSSLARRFPVTLGSEGRMRLNRFARTGKAVRWIGKTDLIGGALPNSRLTLATHAELQLMLVIVDTNRIAGFSIGELADYLAVVTLAHPRFAQAADRRSILAMFDQPRVPGEAFAMTRYDQAYLTGLYKAPDHASSADQERAIAGAMERVLEDDGEP